MRHGVLFTLLLLVAASASLFAVEHSSGLVAGEEQGYVITLTNANNGDVIEGALVEVFGTDGIVVDGRTGADGSIHFFLVPEPGFYAFRATADGYNEYVVVHEAALPTPAPTPAPVFSTPTPVANATTPATITGFITMNPNEKSVFFFGFAMVIACLFGSAYLFYFNYLYEPGEESTFDFGSFFGALNVFREE